MRENVDVLLPAAGVGALLPILQDQPLHQVLGEIIPLGLLEGSHPYGVLGGAILLVPKQGRFGLCQGLDGFPVQRNSVAIDVDGWIVLDLCRKKMCL